MANPRQDAFSKYDLGEISRYDQQRESRRLGLAENATKADIHDAQRKHIEYWEILGVHPSAARSLVYYGVYTAKILNELTYEQVRSIKGIGDSYLRRMIEPRLYRGDAPPPETTYAASFTTIMDALREPPEVAAMKDGKFTIERNAGVTTIKILTG